MDASGRRRLVRVRRLAALGAFLYIIIAASSSPRHTQPCLRSFRHVPPIATIHRLRWPRPYLIFNLGQLRTELCAHAHVSPPCGLPACRCFSRTASTATCRAV